MARPLSQRERCDEDIAVRRSNIAKPEHPYHHFYGMTLRWEATVREREQRMTNMMRAINTRDGHVARLEDQLCGKAAMLADLERQLEEARELLRTIRKKAFGATPHNEQLSLYLLAKTIGEAADEHLRAAEEG